MSELSSWTALTAAAILSGVGPAAAAGCQAHSAPIEYRTRALYFRRLQQLSARRSLAERPCPSAASIRAWFIPLAFHVDYWNQLGWPDRFSQARFSERSGRSQID
jgi:hypothetical protein